MAEFIIQKPNVDDTSMEIEPRQPDSNWRSWGVVNMFNQMGGGPGGLDLLIRTARILELYSPLK